MCNDAAEVTPAKARSTNEIHTVVLSECRCCCFRQKAPTAKPPSLTPDKAFCLNYVVSKVCNYCSRKQADTNISKIEICVVYLQKCCWHTVGLFFRLKSLRLLNSFRSLTNFNCVKTVETDLIDLLALDRAHLALYVNCQLLRMRA